MEINLSCRQLVVASLVAVLLFAGLASSNAQAGIVSTGEVVNEQQSNLNREQLIQELDRAEVRAELERFGVDPAQAQDRVAAMTDAEVLELSAGVDQFVAAGDGGVVTILLVLIIFILLT